MWMPCCRKGNGMDDDFDIEFLMDCLLKKQEPQSTQLYERLFLFVERKTHGVRHGSAEDILHDFYVRVMVDPESFLRKLQAHSSKPMAYVYTSLKNHIIDKQRMYSLPINASMGAARDEDSVDPCELLPGSAEDPLNPDRAEEYLEDYYGRLISLLFNHEKLKPIWVGKVPQSMLYLLLLERLELLEKLLLHPIDIEGEMRDFARKLVYWLQELGVKVLGRNQSSLDGAWDALHPLYESPDHEINVNLIAGILNESRDVLDQWKKRSRQKVLASLGDETLKGHFRHWKTKSMEGHGNAVGTD